ncbi:hypothetical protein K435DRAFT_887286 [Dendrothele bispora CBS 962.96]|uniref:Uncharacterized protein n=1 Tax=Dendrothele bispora (strain CBS 962.96) TaxID=1314807 RepID=A0A4S8KSG0_DENBC|nr:hypothetical protein K435DRAFT_887286 [Dendrothele bispora CBS 962.96]
MSSTQFFTNAHRLAFTQCHFTVAENIYKYSSAIENATGQSLKHYKGDFQTVPIGEIKLEQPVDEEEIEIPVYDGSSILPRLKPTNPFKRWLERQTVKVVRTTHPACLFGQGSEAFTAVTYRSVGPDSTDSYLAWKREYEYYAKIKYDTFEMRPRMLFTYLPRHANVVQLFGITSTTMQMLIYHNTHNIKELISMRTVLYEQYRSHRNDPLIYCYLVFKYVVTIEKVYSEYPELFKDYEVVPGSRGPYFSDQLGEGRTLARVKTHEPPLTTFEDELSIINHVSYMASGFLNSIAWLGLKDGMAALKPYGNAALDFLTDTLGVAIHDSISMGSVTWSNNECAESFSYWSFDPTGEQRLTREEISKFGLPDLDLSVAVGTQWHDRHYRAIMKYLQLKGYNPFSTKYAEDYGFPIFDFVTESLA